MDIEFCFSLISAKFDLEKFKSLVDNIITEQWDGIFNDSTLLWPLYDKHIWTIEEYTKWFNEIDSSEFNLFFHELRDHDEITALLNIIPEEYRIIFIDDLLIIQDEFIKGIDAFELRKYDVDKKKLLRFRFKDFIYKERSITDMKNFILAQVLVLEKPTLCHKVSRSVSMNELQSILDEYDWIHIS
jgi:hypothetical protein